MKCQKCDSAELQYNRDSALVAAALEVRREDDQDVLILDADPVPAWMDNVEVVCESCGHEQEGLHWDNERAQSRPLGETARALAQRAIEAIDGLRPVGGSTDEQAAIVTRLVIRELEDYAKGKEG